MKIIINGRDSEMSSAHSVSYEYVCQVAGENIHSNPTVTYRGRMVSGGTFSGTLTAGQLVEPSDGIVFNCIVTGGA